MDGARGVLFNITGGRDLTLNEISDAAALIGQAADPDANIIFGAVVDEEMQDELKITVIATGFDQIRPLQMGARTAPPRPLRPSEGDSGFEARPSRRFGSRERSPGLDDDDLDLDEPIFRRRERQRGEG
jgi:cell division protein FtsZ